MENLDYVSTENIHVLSVKPVITLSASGPFDTSVVCVRESDLRNAKVGQSWEASISASLYDEGERCTVLYSDDSCTVLMMHSWHCQGKDTDRDDRSVLIIKWDDV